MTIREETERLEKEILSPHACLAAQSRGRRRPEPACPIRTAFQRDRDRIIHSKSFRRLKHKTQVFLAPAGDHYRTRLTHVLEVAQIARTVAVALRLNEPLTEAIALGHDLGHTPFGHAGEAVLDELVPGGFRHAEQSLRVVDFLENKGAGLNLTFEVRDGILKHSKGLADILPAADADLPVTLEAQVVRVADIIAYVNHDLDDALRAGVIRPADLPDGVADRLGDTYSRRIAVMVGDLVTATREKASQEGRPQLALSPDMLDTIHQLRDFLNRRVYRQLVEGKDFQKAMKLIRDLYHYLEENHERCAADIVYAPDTPPSRKAVDFIAGMTDRFAMNIYSEIFLPQPWSVL